MGSAPEFLIVGPPKSGTTALFQALKQHPEIGFPAKKELHFFNKHYDRGLDWYLDQFQSLSPTAKMAEATPNYFSCAQSRARIYRHLPRTKIVCLLRNPVERLISQYTHFRSMYFDNSAPGAAPLPEGEWAGEHRTLDQIIQEFRRDPQNQLNEHDRTRYFSSGEYVIHIREWEALFGADRVLSIFYDDLVSTPHVTLGKLFKWLAVTHWRVEFPIQNTSKYWLLRRPDVKKDVRKELTDSIAEYYKPFNALLFEHLGTQPRWSKAVQ